MNSESRTRRHVRGRGPARRRHRQRGAHATALAPTAGAEQCLGDESRRAGGIREPGCAGAGDEEGAAQARDARARPRGAQGAHRQPAG